MSDASDLSDLSDTSDATALTHLLKADRWMLMLVKNRLGASLSLLLLLGLALTLSGCDLIAGPPPRTPAQPAPAVETPAPTGTVAPAGTDVHFIDVGQGDAALILTPDGKAALIDGGPAGSGVLAYLQSQGVRRLDMVVATHPHEDHIGGLIEVLRSLPVGEVVTNGQPHTTRTYERFLDAIAAARAPYREVRRGDKLQLGSLVLDVLHPVSNTGQNLNDQSIVLRMAHGQVSFLFTGDAERAAEASMVAAGLKLSANILKVGHHGSRTASSAAFLKAVQPQVAVYSAGAGNEFGHPHQQTLSALAKVGASIYGTDKHGTVVVSSDGVVYRVLTSKSASSRGPPGGSG